MIQGGLAVRAFFTTREGGVSRPPFDTLNVATHVGDDPVAVAQNRRQVEAEAGAPVTYVSAEHGIEVAVIDTPGAPSPAADVLIATAPGVAIAAIGADCVPVLLYDGATGAVAAIHAGRRGVYQGVIDAAWAALQDLRPHSGGPPTITASIGPAICGRCYEVSAEVRAEVAQRHPTARSVTREGAPSLDLPRAIEVRLGELGALDIVRIPVCTLEDERMFSYRRATVTGRHAGVIVHP